jgi:hypothetical protein
MHNRDVCIVLYIRLLLIYKEISLLFFKKGVKFVMKIPDRLYGPIKRLLAYITRVVRRALYMQATFYIGPFKLSNNINLLGLYNEFILLGICCHFLLKMKINSQIYS